MGDTITIRTEGAPESVTYDFDAFASIARGEQIAIKIVGVDENGAPAVKEPGCIFSRMTRRQKFWHQNRKLVWPFYWRWHRLWRIVSFHTLHRIWPKTAVWYGEHPMPGQRRGSCYYQTDTWREAGQRDG